MYTALIYLDEDLSLNARIRLCKNKQKKYKNNFTFNC